MQTATRDVFSGTEVTVKDIQRGDEMLQQKSDSAASNIDILKNENNHNHSKLEC